MSLVDRFMLKSYHKDSYNCLHFTRDVWLELLGEDLSERLTGLLGLSKDRLLTAKTFHGFERLRVPASPCVVYMLSLGRDPHVGVFLKGRLFHLRPSGPEFLPLGLASRGHTSLRYYK